MKQKLKICQVTPGLISIPPNGWGATEWVIWNYKKSLEKLGHEVDIKYLNEIDPSDNPYDIIHIHVANLGIEARQRGLKYVLSLHDHHALINDHVFGENEDATNSSLLTIVHGSNMLEKFKHTKKPVYLSHGVDVKYFKPATTEKEHDLLCIANNGLAGNPTYDRKGFRLAIECARELGLSITIAGPENNLKFFDENKDLLTYHKLTILTNLSEDEKLSAYQSHKIFLHLSDLEAGHPNLTLLESLACGTPIVGASSATNLHGMVIVPLKKEDVCYAISLILSNYTTYSITASKHTETVYNWDKITKGLELLYYSEINKNSMRSSLDNVYSNINLNTRISNKYNHRFLDGAWFEVIGSKLDNHNVKFIDRDNNEIVYETTIPTNNWTEPNRKYYTNWNILINNKTSYPLNLENEKVLIHLSSKALGDTLAWLPYAEEFRKKHRCKVDVTTFWNELFISVYPELNFRKPGVSLHDYIAYYSVGCYDNNINRNKNNWRKVPLQQVSSDILGINYKEIVPRVEINNNFQKVTDKKYVAISQNSTMRAKFWNNPKGWETVINYIKEKGYEVVLLQKEDTTLANVIQKTNISIQETIFHLNNAEFYIGLGSGISWLAWALRKPVIMISGFSEPYSEFYTPHRVINKNNCFGCYNDTTHEFDRGNWNWCPRNKNFICTTSITPKMVTDHIDKILNI